MWTFPFVMALAWLGGLFGALGIAAWTQFGPDSGSLRWDLGAVLALAAVIGSGATALAARWLFGKALRPLHPSVVLFWVAGSALAIGEELALHTWASVHIGQYDFDNMGATAYLSAMLLLVVITRLGAEIAPPAARIGSVLLLAGAAALVGVIVLANVPGLRDGIDAESWALAILVGLSGVYAFAAVIVGARRVVP